MLNSISYPKRIRSRAGVLLAAIFGASIAGAPPVAGQQVVLDSTLVILNVRMTEEVPELTDEQKQTLSYARMFSCRAFHEDDDLKSVTSSLAQSSGAAMLLVQGILHSLCDGAPTFETSTTETDYTIFIRENRMAVRVEGSPTMVWKVIPGSHAQMYFYDPETRRIQSFGPPGSGVPLEIINLQGVDRTTRNVATDFELESYGPTLLGPAGERLGYPVDRYEFGHQMTPGLLEGMMVTSPTNETVGSALIARETPYNGVVARFFENFAAHVDSGSDGMLEGLTGQMARLGSLGVPMVTVDTTTATLPLPIPVTDDPSAADEGTGDPSDRRTVGVVVQNMITTTEITDIRFGHLGVELPEEIFGPDPDDLAEDSSDEPAPCDCSCDAFQELQDLDEDDPEAMARAMCAQQCMSRWISCAMQ